MRNLKLTVTFGIVYLCMYSCSNVDPAEVAKRNIEKELQTSLNDPASYEFVSMTALDTIYTLESAKNSLKEYEEMLIGMGDYPNRIKKQEDFALQFGKHAGYEKDAAEAREAAKKLREIYAEVEGKISDNKAIIETTEPNDISEIYTKFKFRAANKMGGKILASYYVALTDSLTVKYMNKE